MSQTATLTVLQQALWTIVELSAPVLLTALVVGVLISLVQAVTQVNENALSYVPKVLCIALVLVFAGPWMLQTLLDFTSQLYTALPSLVQ